MEDDNIIPYEPSPTLTVDQCVIHMLDKCCKFSFMGEMKLIENNLWDYLYDVQDIPDRAHGNASHELYKLEKNDNPAPEAIKMAEEKVASAKVELEKANNLPKLAENFRLLINHEISKVRNGKRSPILVDVDESARAGQTRINMASFQEWLEGMELDDDISDSVPVKLPLVDDALDREMELTKATTESLFLTLGLLVSLFAESSDDDIGSALKPKIIKIAEKIDQHGKHLNDDNQLYGQGTNAVRKRIDVALSTLDFNAYSTLSFK